ncbi:MAG: 2-amino-4-hydroxy-6-hydroxymethyldihydropteridine diphosphokinase [Elusimicrobiaceae bacterium]|nr:2-amino-4-hydroxy-6-hydroxymethyldihydropteridine diphosphokinase [Elusimicrobiaceae bacterium]
MAKVILALGSNMGDPKGNLDRAVTALASIGTVEEVAPYILSKPEGYPYQADFVNTVLGLETQLAPMPLLRALKKLEKDLGRTPTFANGPRLIDLDILFYDDKIVFEDAEDCTLFIPHPRLHEREFVLKPLSYILPDFVHPKLNEPIYMLYRKLIKKKGLPTCQIL